MGRVSGIMGIVCLLVGGSPAAAEEASHVRPLGSYARWLTDSGMTYSVTVSSLAAALDTSDTVAYVAVAAIPSGTAHTKLLNGRGSVRYLLITIDNRLTPDVQIQMLGHELQHAVEIAEAPQVRDQADMIALYQRIGMHRGATNRFETMLAQEAQRRTRYDLSNRPMAPYSRSSQ